MSKLDLHRKTTIAQADPPAAASPVASGGIASLISASHNILPVYSTPAITQLGPNAPTKPPGFSLLNTEPQTVSSLAPSTLANPPAPTNLSKSAVIVSGERGIGVGRSDATGGMPSGIMANLWGSSNWGYINRLEKGEIKSQGQITSVPSSPSIKPLQPSPKIGNLEHTLLYFTFERLKTVSILTNCIHRGREPQTRYGTTTPFTSIHFAI
tara:strand:- start:295 stop:927 length:633 start_codon:yes stop_codon:yes gene_type:complete